MMFLIIVSALLFAPAIALADASITDNGHGAGGTCHFPTSYDGGEVVISPCDIRLVVFNGQTIQASIGTSVVEGAEERVLPVVNPIAPCQNATVKNDGLCVVTDAAGDTYAAYNWVSRVFECKAGNDKFDVKYYLFCGPAALQ